MLNAFDQRDILAAPFGYVFRSIIRTTDGVCYWIERDFFDLLYVPLGRCLVQNRAHHVF